MRRSVFTLCAVFLFAAAELSAPAYADDSAAGDRSKEIIELHRLIVSIRDAETIARNIYFDQTFILLHLHGNRTERIGSYDDPPRMFRAATDSRYVPDLKRFRARVDRLVITEEQKNSLIAALDEVDSAIETGYAMAARLDEDDVDGATALFYERSLPALKASWRGFYTVTSELERSMPRK